MFRHTHPLYKAHDGLPIPAFYPFSKNTSRSEALHLAAANGQEAVVKVRGTKLPGWGVGLYGRMIDKNGDMMKKRWGYHEVLMRI